MCHCIRQVHQASVCAEVSLILRTRKHCVGVLMMMLRSAEPDSKSLETMRKFSEQYARR